MKRLAVVTALFTALSFSGIGAVQAKVLQSQIGMSGEVEADVIQAKVDGNVLTVAVAFRNIGGDKTRVRYKWNDVFFIDKTQNKKYHVLKDDKGAWLASPVYFSGVDYKIPAGAKKIVWFKFPAPPAETGTIDLTLPVTLPFDNLQVAR